MENTANKGNESLGAPEKTEFTVYCRAPWGFYAETVECHSEQLAEDVFRGRNPHAKKVLVKKTIRLPVEVLQSRQDQPIRRTPIHNPDKMIEQMKWWSGELEDYPV